MTRIAVVGNCSAVGIANAIRVMSPGSNVRGLSVADFDPDNASIVDILLEDFDVAFAFAEMKNYTALHERLKKFDRLILWPTIVFSGFHPDIAYFHIRGKPVASCLGLYNSTIAAFAYGRELSVKNTANLFNSLTYGLLGYYDAYPLWRQILLDSAKSHDLDLSTAFAKWEASGVFMHTINHATIMVINDLARELMNSAGLKIEADIDHKNNATDYLADGIIWPVYPELAKRIGTTGSFDFKTSLHMGSKTMGLEEFISDSFKQYENNELTPSHFRETHLYQSVAKKLSFVG